MKNKLSDLNDHLFMQIERLNDETIAGDNLKEEILRAQAITSVANAIVQNGNLAFKAHTHAVEWEKMSKIKLPTMLTD